MKARAITPANDQKEKKNGALEWFDGLRPGEGIKKKKKTAFAAWVCGTRSAGLTWH